MRGHAKGTGADVKAVVIGGGIGGLASALALARRGWEVEVLERAPEFTEVGAGLSLWANGVRALDALGVGESVRERAALEGQGGIQDAAGRWLARTDQAELTRRYGPTVMIHRADLLALLCAAVPTEALRSPAGWTPTTASGGRAPRRSPCARTGSGWWPSGPPPRRSPCATPPCGCCRGHRLPGPSDRCWTGPREPARGRQWPSRG